MVVWLHACIVLHDKFSVKTVQKLVSTLSNCKQRERMPRRRSVICCGSLVSKRLGRTQQGGQLFFFFGLELFFNHTIILFCNSTLSYDGNEQDHTTVTIAMPSEVCSMFRTEVRWCRTVVEGWGATIPLNLPTSTWLTHGLRRGKITKTSL